MVNVELKKGAADFRLVGKLKVTERSFTLDKKSESGFISNQAYIGVECGEGNVVHARMFAGYTDGKVNTLYVHGKTYDEETKREKDDYQNSFQIGWEDRWNPNHLERIGPSCFTTVGLTKTKNAEGKDEIVEVKFVSQYDAISYIKETLDKMADEVKENLAVDVRGKIQYNYYDGKINVQKNITSIKLTNLPQEKWGSKFTQTCYINKDNVGDFDKVSNTRLVNVRVPEYISKVDGIEVKRTIPLTYPMHLDMTKTYSTTLLKWFKSEDKYGKYLLVGKFSDIGSTETVDLSNYSDDVRELLNSGDWDEEESNPTVANSNSVSEDMIITNIRTSNVVENGIARIVANKESGIYTIPELENIYTDFQKTINPPETDEMPSFLDDDDMSDEDWLNSLDGSN